MMMPSERIARQGPVSPAPRPTGAAHLSPDKITIAIGVFAEVTPLLQVMSRLAALPAKDNMPLLVLVPDDMFGGALDSWRRNSERADTLETCWLPTRAPDAARITAASTDECLTGDSFSLDGVDFRAGARHGTGVAKNWRKRLLQLEGLLSTMPSRHSQLLRRQSLAGAAILSAFVSPGNVAGVCDILLAGSDYAVQAHEV